MIQEQQETSPIIFISYSHKDIEWKDKIVPFFKQLELLELVELCNDQQIGRGPDWYANIKSVLERTRFAICLISKNYLSSRFCIDEEFSYLLQQRAKGDLEIIPILISDCLWEAEPWLRRLQMVPGNGKNLTTDFRDDPDPELVKVARHVYKALQPGYVRPQPAPPAGTPPEKVDITRLPETGELLFGRKDEIRFLDKAWESDDVNIVEGTRTLNLRIDSPNLGLVSDCE